MYGHGEPINQRVFRKLDEAQQKRIEKHIDENAPNRIFKTFPDEKILEENVAVRYLMKENNLSEDTVVRSLNNLIKEKKLATAYDTKQRLHLRKNKFA